MTVLSTASRPTRPAQISRPPAPDAGRVLTPDARVSVSFPRSGLTTPPPPRPGTAFQPSGFPVRDNEVRAWVPGRSTPTSRPLAVAVKTSGARSLPAVSRPRTPLAVLTGRAVVTAMFTCVVVGIPGGCWAVAVALEFV